jgi:hypothetical protein
MPKSIQRIRYPPFEHQHMKPISIPIVEEMVDFEYSPIPNFTIGTDDGWFVEWREPTADEREEMIAHDIDVGSEIPGFIRRSRYGWFIDPDPLHQISRMVIPPTVALLILALFIHAIEPGLVEWGVISSSIAGSFQFGPLDYPKLLMIAFPVFLIPLLFRMIANFRDLARQRHLINSNFESPEISIDARRSKVNIQSISIPSSLSLVKSRVQVGVAVPERSAVLNALRRIEGGQPSPGMSTKLSQKRIVAGDEEGTGVGEVTPMLISDSKPYVLEPMRVMDTGEWVSYETNNLGPVMIPPKEWPGTVYSPLIAIHWEAVFVFQSIQGRYFKWVEPIEMIHSERRTIIQNAPLRSGRAELSNQ